MHTVRSLVQMPMLMGGVEGVGGSIGEVVEGVVGAMGALEGVDGTLAVFLCAVGDGGFGALPVATAA